MIKNSRSEQSVALLWDESFLWGVMAYKALQAIGLPFQFIRSEDVKKGKLSDYSLLFVPGGWASNKSASLGEDGARAIRQFVEKGGSYLGFCGGAGLATEDGIGLVPVKRRPTAERVPSFSGRIGITPAPHELWLGVREPVFHAWWPSQFIVDDRVSVLATYGEAMPDSFSSDINVGDAENGNTWADLERVYGINLDPKRLRNEPAVIEAPCGKGRVLLSLLHFDTPDDRNGAIVLRNIWRYLVPKAVPETPSEPEAEQDHLRLQIGGELQEAVTGLIDLGTRNFLWFRKNPLLIQWRRGVRGLEYCTLFVLIQEITGLLRKGNSRLPGIEESLVNIRAQLLPFIEQAKRLLVKERYALQGNHITYERCDDPEIRALRDDLFSRSKSYGGRFKRLIDGIDRLHYRLLSGLKSGSIPGAQ